MAGICRRTLQNVTVGVIIASGSGNRSRIGSSAPETEAGQGLFPAQGRLWGPNRQRLCLGRNHRQDPLQRRTLRPAARRRLGRGPAAGGSRPSQPGRSPRRAGTAPRPLSDYRTAAPLQPAAAQGPGPRGNRACSTPSPALKTAAAPAILLPPN